jgi:APA family basic amino acid/polyamine antiporter
MLVGMSVTAGVDRVDGEVLKDVAVARPELPRKVGFWGAIAVMVGVVIGSGIFATPTTIAKNLGSPTLILALWVVGGLIALCGALTFAELGALLPRTGGIYVFLREGLGACPAFVFGWTYMLIAKPAAAGGIATVFSTHFKSLTGLDWNAPLLTCGALFVLTLINVLGVRGSARFAIALTGLKYAAIGAIIFLGVFAAVREMFFGGAGAGAAGAAAHFAATEAPRSLLRGIVPVMAAIMWTYDGWSDVGSIAGEVEDAERTLPRVFIIGTLAVIALYVLANAVYLWHLPLADMRQTETVAPLLLTRLVGKAGMAAVTVLIILSTLGSSHASIMTGARVTFAQARDGLLFRFLGRVNPRFQTPAVSLWMQLVLSCAMVLVLRDFQSLADSFIFTIWIFYGLAAVSVFILRARMNPPSAGRPFSVPGYPYVPAIFVLASIVMTVLAIMDDWKTNCTWLGILVAGVPVYFLWRRMFPDAGTEV